MEMTRSFGRLAIALLIAGFLFANLKQSFTMVGSSASLTNDLQGWHPSETMKSPKILHHHDNQTTTKVTTTKVMVSPFMNRSRNNSHTHHKKLRPRQVFLIHVGKTGGETVRHTLKITCKMRKNEIHQHACWDNFNATKESQLSKHTVGTMHCDLILPKKGMERATTLLWTIRNPLTRIISWYRYTSPANCDFIKDYYSTACNTNRSIDNNLKKLETTTKPKWVTKFFFMCFPTMNDFARALGTKSDTEIHENAMVRNRHSPKLDFNCTDLAWRTIRGLASPSSSHAHFNYQFYWRETIEKYSNLEVWAIRTEHLWDDLDGIEYNMFKANTMAPPQHAHEKSPTTTTSTRKDVTHGSEGHVQRGYLSPANKRNLCCALVDEMAIYKQVLMRATNLNATARDQSLAEVVRDCGGIDFFFGGGGNASLVCK